MTYHDQPLTRLASDRWAPLCVAGRAQYLAGFVAFCCLALPTTQSQADEWFLEGRASVISTYDDNVRLRDKNKEDALGVIIRPELDIHGRGQRWDVNLTNFAAFERYDDSNFDSDNFGIELDSVYRTQLQSFELDGLVSRETTLASEQTDTGDFEDEGFKHTFEFDPSWSYQFTPRQSVFMGAGVTVVDYTSTDRFDDFQTYSGNVGWGYQLTQQDEVSTSFVYSHNNSDDDENSKSDFYGIGLGWEREISERLNWFIQAGPRYFESEEDRFVNGQTKTDKDSSFGGFLNGRLNYRVSEQTRIRAGVESRVTGSGDGGAVQKNSVRFNISHRFLPKWTASLASTFQINQDPNDDDDSRDRNFFRVRPRVSWQFLQDWQLSASYRFRTDNEDGEKRAYSNAVFFGLTYSTPKWTFAN
jgi:hypothetical protein